RCGGTVALRSPALRCIKCGITCCTTCSYVLGSDVCCIRCAETMLHTGDAPLASPVPPEPTLGGSVTTDVSTPSAEDSHWIVVVARDQPDLFEHLERSFRGDPKVQVILDRRKDFVRNPPGVAQRLRIHGAAVVRRVQR